MCSVVRERVRNGMASPGPDHSKAPPGPNDSGRRTAGLDPDRRRTLIVVNERIEGPQLRRSLEDQLGKGEREVYVIAPALADSGVKHMMGDVDGAIEPAHERLRVALRDLRESGFTARGEVGDADPIQAISDGIVKYDADQVLVVGHSDEESPFAEKGLLERAGARLRPAGARGHCECS